MVEMGADTFLMDQATAAVHQQLKEEKHGYMKQLYDLMKIDGDI
jgi:hypothetical protein